MKLLVFKGGSQVTCCPKCGSDDYYVEVIVSGRSGWHRSLVSGESSDNIGFWDHVDQKVLKTAFCTDCFEKLGTVRNATET